MKLLQSYTKQSVYCYRKPVLTSWVDKYTNGREQFMRVYTKKYVAWLHVLTLCTSQGSHVHTLFLRWYAPVAFQTRMEKSLRSLALQLISNCCKYRSHSTCTVLIQQVPFSGLYFDELVSSLQIRITVLFSTDLITPRIALLGFPRLCRHSKTFLRIFFTPVHTQSLLRSRDAAWIDENWTLTEWRVHHLERTVPGVYLLSYHTVIHWSPEKVSMSMHHNAARTTGRGEIDAQYNVDHRGRSTWQFQFVAQVNVKSAYIRCSVLNKGQFNSSRAKFCRGNINIYLHFMSLLHIDMTRVLKILPQVRPGPTYST